GPLASNSVRLRIASMRRAAVASAPPLSSRRFPYPAGWATPYRQEIHWGNDYACPGPLLDHRGSERSGAPARAENVLRLCRFGQLDRDDLSRERERFSEDQAAAAHCGEHGRTD